MEFFRKHHQKQILQVSRSMGMPTPFSFDKEIQALPPDTESWNRFVEEKVGGLSGYDLMHAKRFLDARKRQLDTEK